MPSLYNCRHDGDQYRITKLDSDWNVEASYLCDLVACECPAGHRPRCRHREMLPKFIQRNYIGTAFFFDFDRGGWVQGASKDLEPSQTEFTSPLVVSGAESSGVVASTVGEEDKGSIPSALSLTTSGPSLTIATEITLPADATPDEVAEAFGNLLAPAGLGQASEQRPSPITTEELDKAQFGKVLHSRSHSQMVTTTDFESVGDGSSPSVAAKTTIRRRV